MKLRTDRHNPRTLYIQTGDQPADTDPCIGFAVDPEAARGLIRLVNEYTSPTDRGALLGLAVMRLRELP